MKDKGLVILVLAEFSREEISRAMIEHLALKDYSHGIIIVDGDYYGKHQQNKNNSEAIELDVGKLIENYPKDPIPLIITQIHQELDPEILKIRETTIQEIYFKTSKQKICLINSNNSKVRNRPYNSMKKTYKQKK